MSKTDFTKALNNYEYYLRASVNPNIDNYFFSSIPALKKTYFILGLPNVLSLIHYYLNPSLQIDESIINDPAVIHHKDCFGVFVYDEHFDQVYICGNKDFKSGTVSSFTMIDSINDFIKRQQNTSSSSNGIQSNWAATYSSNTTVKQPENPVIIRKCDCGAHKLGYKDDDQYGHAYWCSTMSHK